jgi:hypothetical protein
MAIALAAGWLLSRRRLGGGLRVTPEERLAGHAVALGWLAAVALFIGLVKPYALVFVLPSLYAWLWLPLQARLWARAGLFGIGLLGPLAGLVALGAELDLGVFDTSLYVAGLATVGYVSPVSVLLALAWATAAAQLGALAVGRYRPYAGGVEPPPPGIIRGIVDALRDRSRGAYGRAT